MKSDPIFDTSSYLLLALTAITIEGIYNLDLEWICVTAGGVHHSPTLFKFKLHDRLWKQ